MKSGPGGRYANDALKLSLKGLWFFCSVSPSELPKVMGLKGFIIQMPFARSTFCPVCGMEGQNEGTVVNHMQTMHYKPGLVCGRCLHFPLITSEAIQHHGQGCKQPMGKWCPRGRQGAWQCIHIKLTSPNHPLWPKHYLPWQWWCKCLKSLTLPITLTFQYLSSF